mmetsp:Transcript_19788/g.47063  ORF Transcript_19788/g.47063 Transcript_19788/m.47063 type:complete len:194 (+) Transcript_19788:53-634(+)
METPEPKSKLPKSTVARRQHEEQQQQQQQSQVPTPPSFWGHALQLEEKKEAGTVVTLPVTTATTTATMMMMKSFLSLLLLSLSSLAFGFTNGFTNINNNANTHLLLPVLCSKKFPAGRPNTDQVDEDMAMWFEDKDGKQKKALSKPVGGRPVNLYTKNQLQDIEAKGVDPFEKIKAFGKFLTQKPKAGDKWRQ